MDLKIHKVPHPSVAFELKDLQPFHIPEHLSLEGGPKREGDFDPNCYFPLLRNLSATSGFVLDYYYATGHIAGQPCLYFRKSEDKPFHSEEEYRYWVEKHALLEFIELDGSVDAFYQLSVFNLLAGAFYLFWHARYRNVEIVLDPVEQDPISDQQGKEYPVQDDGLKRLVESRELPNGRIDVHPVVAFSDTRAYVKYFTYSSFGGYYMKTDVFSRSFPHLLLDSGSVLVKKYDSGIIF